MKNHTRWLFSLLGFSFAVAAPAVAQSRGGSPIEIGMDAQLGVRSIDFGGGSSSETFIQLPVSQIRVGFYLNDMIELEPSLGLSYVNIGGHSTSANFIVGLPINLQTNRAVPNWYVRPLVGFQHLSESNGGGDHSATQISFGAGVGIRLPIDPRLGGRFEANYTHGNHNDDISSYNQFGLLAGLSFYTR